MNTTIVKCIFLALLAMGLHGNIHAQNQLPLSVSYYGHMGMQPGLKVGLDFPVKSWEKQGERLKARQLFLSPQLGGFFAPGITGFMSKHSDVVLNVDFGYRSQPVDGNWYYSFAAGMGLLGQSLVLSETWSLGNGGLLEKEREFTLYLLPTVNFEFGRKIGDRMEIFQRTTYGSRLNPNRESSAMLFAELGLTIYLKGVSHE